MMVEVGRISDKYIFYSIPGELNMDRIGIDKGEAHTIFYKTGEIEEFTRSLLEIGR